MNAGSAWQPRRPTAAVEDGSGPDARASWPPTRRGQALLAAWLLASGAVLLSSAAMPPVSSGSGALADLVRVLSFPIVRGALVAIGSTFIGFGAQAGVELCRVRP